MHRCSHLYESGRQCGQYAMDGSDFCPDHEVIDHVHDDALEPLEENGVGRVVVRVAALLLLIIFLIPFYYTIQSLYATFTVELDEAR